MRLSVVIPVRSDPVVWATLNSLGLYHDHLFADPKHAEIVVVDSSPEGSELSSQLGKHLRSLKSARYSRYIGPASSCLYKDVGMREATGDVRVCIDSHVLLRPGSLDAILAYFDDDAHAQDMLTAVCMNNAWTVQGTNQMIYADESYDLPRGVEVVEGVVWRGDKIGAWVRDRRGLNPHGVPFEIQQAGTFAFAMRGETWPGFHPAMTGFGGNETYLMERVRAAGGRVLCHPAFRGVHDFMNQDRHDYPTLVEDVMKNYLIGFEAIDTERGRQLHRSALQFFRAFDRKRFDLVTSKLPASRTAVFDLQPLRGVEKKGVPQRAIDKPGVYERFLPLWEDAGGDAAGAVCKPMFQAICHIRPVTLDLESGVERPTRTIEFGCGLSTLGFDRQKTIHTAVEDNAQWIERVKPLLKGDTVTLLNAPLKDGWYDWRPKRGDLYDVVLIDGPFAQNRPEARGPAADCVPEMLVPGGRVLIDDTHREGEQSLSSRIAERLGTRSGTIRNGGRSFDVVTAPAWPKEDGPGTRLLKRMQVFGVPACSLCVALAWRMNRWGADGCRASMSVIVEDILPRARHWYAGSHPWMKIEAWFRGNTSLFDAAAAAVRGKGDIDAVLRQSIQDLVEEVLKEAT